MDIEIQAFARLAVALAIGLLIGVERGWNVRDAGEGQRVTGLRTFSLIGLLGGAAGLLGDRIGAVLIGLLFIGLSLLLAAAYFVQTRERDDIGLTTEIAAMGTFVLGALAGVGQVALASASGVVVALLLSYKSLLHGWLGALKREELTAGIQLLLMSVVMLPLLPNQGYGPWQSLNPHVIWWMVVLIAALSFTGYAAVRIIGARAGIIVTALFGGVASSTAVTLTFARMAARQKTAAPLLAAGILLACGTMFPRMLLIASLVDRSLFAAMVWPVMAMTVPTYITALVLFQLPNRQVMAEDALPKNPLEVSSSLTFGALLALVMFLSKALTVWLGDAGAWVLAAASGVADVDAITLALARMSRADLTQRSATVGIAIAASVNSAVKSGLALTIGGRAVGLRVAVPLGLAVVFGLLVAIVQSS